MAPQCGRRQVLPQLRTSDPCAIASEVKKRNGSPLQWCSTHGREVHGDANGSVPGACDGAAAPPVPDDEVLEIDLDDYRGGVACWGATKPVVAIGDTPCRDHGVHVHARKEPDGPKVIDDSFTIVRITSAGRQVTLDEESALAHVASAVAGYDNVVLRCTHCGFEHLDRDIFAVEPHRKHLCNRCGRNFWAKDATVSNPAVAVSSLPGVTPPPPPVASAATIAIDSSHYSGVAIWPSNPAIVWTAATPEKTGIHVHAWDADGNLVIDETYASVALDGTELDEQQLRWLMVQRIVNTDPRRIGVVRCPNCDRPHADADSAFVATNRKQCAYCKTEFSTPRRRRIVSNPILENFPDPDTTKRGE